jgi:hypothetical protein
MERFEGIENIRERKENDFPSCCLVNRKERKDHFINFTILPLYYILYIKFFWIKL